MIEQNAVLSHSKMLRGKYKRATDPSMGETENRLFAGCQTTLKKLIVFRSVFMSCSLFKDPQGSLNVGVQ